MSGGRMLHQFSNHQKTITSLALDSSQSRLLSGSLDHSVKIYDLATYKVAHSLKYAAPVLSLAMSVGIDINIIVYLSMLNGHSLLCLSVIQPTNEALAVGLLDGTLSVRRRTKKAQVAEVSIVRYACSEVIVFELSHPLDVI
jgi:U3 small nucleolar RNA-associated protein 15